MNKEMQERFDEIEKQINDLVKEKDEIYRKANSEFIDINCKFFKDLEGKSFISRKHPDHIYRCIKFNGMCEDGVDMFELCCHDLYDGKDNDSKPYVYYRVLDIRFYNKDDFDRTYEIKDATAFNNRISKVFNNILSDLGI